MELFTGPGKHLEIPTEWVDYPENDCPICKRNIINGVNRYTGSNNPYVLAFPHGYYKIVTVPFGYWYEMGGGTAQVVRPWTYEEMKDWMRTHE